MEGRTGLARNILLTGPHRILHIGHLERHSLHFFKMGLRFYSKSYTSSFSNTTGYSLYMKLLC